MKVTKNSTVIERLISPLGECLTAESARRVLALKADPTLQDYVDDLATRHSEGRLTTEEQSEYGRFVSYATFIAVLKSQARQLLATTSGE